MIFVTGPFFAGKQEYICSVLGLTGEQFMQKAIRDVQDLVVDESGAAVPLEELAERLAGYEIVLATEVGGGIVPMEPLERLRREQAGRLACMLAERADTVVRVCCGLGQVLKGELPKSCREKSTPTAGTERS